MGCFLIYTYYLAIITDIMKELYPPQSIRLSVLPLYAFSLGPNGQYYPLDRRFANPN